MHACMYNGGAPRCGSSSCRGRSGRVWQTPRSPKSYPHPQLQDFPLVEEDHGKAQGDKEQPGGGNPGVGISFGQNN